jgi:glycosyltransferase involved in cell wall biosynthesis
MFRKIGYLSAIPAIKILIRLMNPDILHAHYLSSYGAAAWICGFHPLVVSAWGTDIFVFPHHSLINRWLIRRITDSADAILSTSRFMASEVKRYTAKQVMVTPFGVDTSLFRPMPMIRRKGQEETIGSVKALERQYGMDVVIKSFAGVVADKKKKPLKLEIVGSGQQEGELKRLAIHLGIASKVNFAGFIEHSKLPEIFNSFSVAAYGSICPESFGVSLLEAQACGVPVVASDIGGFREVVRHGFTGLLVPAGNHQAMAEAIGELLDDHEKRKRFSRAAREFVAAEYFWEKTIDCFMAQYYRLISTDK